MKKHGQKRSFMLRLLLVAVVLIATYDGASAGARIAAGRQTLHAGRQSQNQQSGAPVLAPPIAAEHGRISAEQQAKHYVILVSLDGFRYDYPQKYDAKNLIELGARGASAPEGMIPAYPSITFRITTPSSPDFIPNTMESLRTPFMIPARKQVYSYESRRR